MPIGLVATFSSMFVAVLAARFKNKRCVTAVVTCLIPIACLVAMMKLPFEEKYKRLGVYYPAFTYWAGYPLGRFDTRRQSSCLLEHILMTFVSHITPYG